MSTARRLGNAYVRVLGLGADVSDATRASVLVFTDAERYVFNVGEGFQRMKELISNLLNIIKKQYAHMLLVVKLFELINKY